MQGNLPFNLNLSAAIGLPTRRKSSEPVTITSINTNTNIAAGMAANPNAPPLYLISQNDEVYENDILRSPGSVKAWLDYAHFKRQYGTLLEQSFVLERACNALPRSYKLWKMYLELRVSHLKGKSPARWKREFQKVSD